MTTKLILLIYLKSQFKKKSSEKQEPLGRARRTLRSWAGVTERLVTASAGRGHDGRCT